MYSIDIREFRRANKMTQQELADYFGVVRGLSPIWKMGVKSARQIH